jgi:hypothetical protein
VTDTSKKEWELDRHKLEFINANGRTWLQNPSYFLNVWCAYHIVTKSFIWNFTIQNKKARQELQKREKAFVQYVKTMKIIKHSITLTQLRQTFAKITQGKGKCLPRMVVQGEVGSKCSKEHNPNLLVQVAHGLEVGHVKGLCPTNVESFYNNVTQKYNLHNYMPKCIWNCNESNAPIG